jgi:hypothetical protein
MHAGAGSRPYRVYTNTSRNLDRRLLTSQAKDYERHLAMLNPGQAGVKNGQLDTKEATILWRTAEDRGKFYSTYVNKESCSGLAASGRRRSCPSSQAAAVPAPQERNSRNIFPIIIFTTQDTLPFSQSTPRLTFLRCWIAFICTQCCTGNSNGNNNNTKGIQTPSNTIDPT